MKFCCRGGLMRPNTFYLAMPWLACLVACTAVNFFYFPHAVIFPDEQRFLASAVKLASSGEFWAGSDRAWEMPGTALFYAPLVRLFGADVVPIRFAQSLLLIIQTGLIALTAQRIFGNTLTAFVAASLAALYPFALFYQGLLLSETLFTTLLLASVAALYWWRERGCEIGCPLIIVSLCFAAATLTKATLTVLPPFLIAVTACTAGASLRRALVILAVSACLYGAFLSPWWIRNAVVLGSFVPFTTGSAQNLYLGNNPTNPDAGIDWAANAESAVMAKIAALPGEVERQAAYSRAATDYIKDNPAAFVSGAFKKFIRFWNLVPNAAEFRTGLYSIISVASFGSILALALVCALHRRRQWRLFAPLYLIIGYFTFVHMVTIASLRYRFPIEPILILLAAEPLARIVERIRTRVARAA